jgi:hypothetical protein
MTTFDASFLRAVVLLTGFKPEPMRRAQAALLLLAMREREFTAADLPGEITNGSRHIAGAATGALISDGLLRVVGRVKSPNPNAKGRKLDLLKLTFAAKAAAWLRANGIAVPASIDQPELPI